MLTPATYQAVQVGSSRWVHARSTRRRDVAVCGLQNGGGAFVFTDTDQPITCPFCLRIADPKEAA
jgi:hypothetical protein